MVTGPENAVSQVERRHSHAAPGLGGRVCVVVGDEDGRRQKRRKKEDKNENDEEEERVS